MLLCLLEHFAQLIQLGAQRFLDLLRLARLGLLPLLLGLLNLALESLDLPPGLLQELLELLHLSLESLDLVLGFVELSVVVPDLALQEQDFLVENFALAN